MRSRRWLLVVLLVLGMLFAACPQQTTPLAKLPIGVVSYDEGSRSLAQYEGFKNYLSKQIQGFVELEPAFNELQAVAQIERGAWSMVFAPPGLSAIAIGSHQYIPIFPLEGANHLHSVIVVPEDSPINSLSDLQNKVVALGEPGSASGYYLPLYDLYGLTLAEIQFAPTPTTVLSWVARGKVDAGALSEQQFQRDRGQFDRNFRVLHVSREIPSGAVLISPAVDRTQQARLEIAMREASPNIVGDAGYLPKAPIPNYKPLIELVEKVRPLEKRVRQKPAILTPENSSPSE